MRKRLIVLAPLVLSTVLLSGCSFPVDEETSDRSSGNAAEADEINDVDSVEVFRNIDAYPNIARVCIDGVAFATTSAAYSTKSPDLERVVEWDATCGPQ